MSNASKSKYKISACSNNDNNGDEYVFLHGFIMLLVL